jgi:hypothetical protein
VGEKMEQSQALPKDKKANQGMSMTNGNYFHNVEIMKISFSFVIISPRG